MKSSGKIYDDHISLGVLGTKGGGNRFSDTVQYFIAEVEIF
jgi:hypothetical protein